MSYLIAYDIVDPQRWRQVHRLVDASGYHLQYSLFWFEYDYRGVRGLATKLEFLIDIRRDDVRFYHHPIRMGRWQIGMPAWPTGIQHPAAHCLRLKQITSSEY